MSATSRIRCPRSVSEKRKRDSCNTQRAAGDG